MFGRRRYQILTPERVGAATARRQRRMRLLGIVAAVLLVAVAAGFLILDLLPEPPPSEDYSSSIDSSGQDRWYDVHLPPNYNRSRLWPLVLAFHGFTQTAVEFRAMSGIDALADQEGFIVVYPHGFLRQWQTDEEYPSDVDDLLFVSALLDRLQEELSIDADRIYAAGYSQGGFFALRLACRLSDRIAAFGSVGGSMTPAAVAGCRPARGVPVIVIHGTHDRVILYDPDLENPPALPIPDLVDLWIDLDGCGSAPARTGEIDPVEDGMRVHYAMYGGCQDGAEVALYAVEGGGHTWPGGSEPVDPVMGQTSQDIDANVVLWDFFDRHPLP